MAVPRRDDLLIGWGKAFLSQLEQPGNPYGVSLEQLSELRERYDAYVAIQTAVRAAAQAGAMSKAMYVQRDEAKAALLERARPMYAWIATSPVIPPEMKMTAGVAVPGSRVRRVGVPDRAPLVDATAGGARRVTVFLRDPNPTEGRRVLGATILTYTGTHPPTEDSAWSFARNAMRRKVTLQFPCGAEMTTVWITACYFNERGEIGEFGRPAQVYLVPYVAPVLKKLNAA